MAEQSAVSSRFMRLMLSCFRCVPTHLRIRFFVSLFLLFYHLSPRRRLIAIYNLKNAFPEKSLADICLIAKGVYRNMAIVAAEFFDIPGMTQESLRGMVDVEGLEHCVEALKKNRGILMFGAHFGNWELQAIFVSLLLGPLAVIYRTLDNRFLDHLVTSVRSSTGNKPVVKQRAMLRMLRALKANGIVGLLIDQNSAWQEGVFVDFFGRPACTTNGLALLALHTGSPVIPAFMVRLASGKYRLVFGAAVEIVKTDQQERDVLINTQNFSRIIEDVIRQYPDQWLWVHQRWKTRMPERAVVSADAGASPR